jgi:hypothetical protein
MKRRSDERPFRHNDDMRIELIALAFIHAPTDPPPPDPLPSKAVNGTNGCRYAYASVQACNPLVGCHPIYTQLAPGFWDQP